ncbi:hypothetical protein AB0I59_38785 [Microtetraspora glauca]|uniref:DUF7711 domain-containing protein n=1 Tax=Microtetraspora glauca TaxID=1996 RepID=A0ABV3GSG2_MICGL
MEEPFLREAYVFGDVLAGADPLDNVEVAFVLNLPPEDVPWESHPRGTEWLADLLRLDKGGVAYWWRSHLEPVWSHVISGPVRFWSLDGPDEIALDALAERRFDRLRQVAQPPGDERAQVVGELRTALSHLRAVHARYWEHEWRHEHRGGWPLSGASSVGGRSGVSGPP